LDAVQQTRLRQLLSEAVANGERWTGRRVAGWMSEQLQRPVGIQRGCEMLRRLGFSPSGRVPNTNRGTWPNKPASKNNPDMMDRLARGGRRLGEQHEYGSWMNIASVYCPCYSGFGLPAATVQCIRYALVFSGCTCMALPTSGRSFWLLMPTVSAVAFTVAVQAFADFDSCLTAIASRCSSIMPFGIPVPKRPAHRV